MDFKRALIRVLKGTFCKSIGRLLEAKRACIGFELRENSLQIANDIGISYLKITNSDNIYLSFIVQLSSFVRLTNKNYTYCGLMTDLALTEEPENRDFK